MEPSFEKRAGSKDNIMPNQIGPLASLLGTLPNHFDLSHHVSLTNGWTTGSTKWTLKRFDLRFHSDNIKIIIIITSYLLFILFCSFDVPDGSIHYRTTSNWTDKMAGCSVFKILALAFYFLFLYLQIFIWSRLWIELSWNLFHLLAPWINSNTMSLTS